MMPLTLEEIFTVQTVVRHHGNLTPKGLEIFNRICAAAGASIAGELEAKLDRWEREYPVAPAGEREGFVLVPIEPTHAIMSVLAGDGIGSSMGKLHVPQKALENAWAKVLAAAKASKAGERATCGEATLSIRGRMRAVPPSIVQRPVFEIWCPLHHWDCPTVRAISHREPEKNWLQDFVDLSEAVRDLYYAAHWTPDRPCDADKLWTAVRDAAHLTPGHAPKPLVTVEAPAERDGLVSLLRNPWGQTNNDRRRNIRAAADRIEADAKRIADTEARLVECSEHGMRERHDLRSKLSASEAENERLRVALKAIRKIDVGHDSFLGRCGDIARAALASGGEK